MESTTAAIIIRRSQRTFRLFGPIECQTRDNGRRAQPVINYIVAHLNSIRVGKTINSIDSQSGNVFGWCG